MQPVVIRSHKISGRKFTCVQLPCHIIPIWIHMFLNGPRVCWRMSVNKQHCKHHGAIKKMSGTKFWKNINQGLITTILNSVGSWLQTFCIKFRDFITMGINSYATWFFKINFAIIPIISISVPGCNTTYGKQGWILMQATIFSRSLFLRILI